MKYKLTNGLLAMGVLLLMSGCTGTGQGKETDPVINTRDQTEISEPEAEPEKVPEEEPEVLTEDEAQDGSESAIVLQDGQPDENATAVMYYKFEKEYTDENGEVFGKVTFSIPQLTMRSMAAGDINQDILDCYETMLASADEMAEPYDNWEDTENLPYTLDVGYTLTYLDEEKICLLLEGYEYTGGAHGMPFREALIYNTGSGERIEAEKLFDVTEEEFSEMFIAAFSGQIADAPEDYWADAMDYVTESATFANARFYLSESGVNFYFEPYTLAAYAFGYIEAGIPYEQLPLKQSE